jgi:hypothetical protein
MSATDDLPQAQDRERVPLLAQFMSKESDEQDMMSMPMAKNGARPHKLSPSEWLHAPLRATPRNATTRGTG